MSRTPLAFAPDPTKWIDTSSSSSTKKRPSQRPLVGFRNNISTPPPSTLRKFKGKHSDETPLARQSHIAGYLTPPTTTSAAKPRQRLERLRREVEDELRNTTPTTTTASGGAAGGGARRIEDFWGSSDSEPGPSKLSPPLRTRHDPVHRPTQERPTVSPARKRIGATQPIRSSLLPPPRSPSPVPAAISSDPPAPLSGSPPPDRTPIPDHVLDLHKRLCHQDTVRKQRVRSPWRRDRGDLSSPVRRPKVKERASPTRDIENRVKGIKEKDKVNGTGKKRGLLVSLSDEEQGTPVRNRSLSRDKQPLRSLKPNAGSQRSQKSQKEDRAFVTGFTSPRKKLRPAASRENTQPLPLHPTSRQTASQRKRIDPLPDSPEMPQQPASTTPLEDDNVAGTSLPLQNHLITPHQPASPTTPRKHLRRSPHHQISPPKSRSPQHMHELNETLFAFPPPRQPRFEPEREFVHEEKKKEWKPVDMDAETLMTWSLGFNCPPLPQMPSSDEPQREPEGDDLPEDAIMEGETALLEGALKPKEFLIVERPDPTPIQKHKRRRSSSCSDTESLAPSIASQSFPNLVHSSPSKQCALSSKLLQLQNASYGHAEVNNLDAEEAVEPPVRGQSRSDQQRESLAPSLQSQSFPNFVHSSPKQRSSEAVHALAKEEVSSPVKQEPNEQNEDQRQSPSSRQHRSPSKTRSPTNNATPRPKGEDRWKTLESGILSVPVAPKTPASASVSSQWKRRKTDATQDAAAQTKLAAFGFFHTPTQGGRTTRSAAKAFEKKWEDEEDLDLDEKDMEDRDGNGEAHGRTGVSSVRQSGTPRTRTSQRLGKVPDAPYHPSLRPAGIAELKKREKAQTVSEASGKPSQRLATINSPRRSPREPPRKQPLSSGEHEASVPKLGTHGEPQPSSSDLTSLSSSSEEELFPGFSGMVGTAEEWFEKIADRRSSEFGSFTSI